MDNPAAWAVILLAVALILLVAELLVPTGGLVGVLAGLSLIGGIFMLFAINTATGLIGAAVTVVVGIPLGMILIVKVWPNTPIARTMTLKNPQLDSDESPSKAPASDGRSPRVGQTGKALTDMRPVGACLIGQQRIECLAESGMIPAGTPVRVVATDGMQVKVRAEDV